MFKVHATRDAARQLNAAKAACREARDSHANASEIAEHDAELKRIENALRAKATRIWLAKGSEVGRTITLSKAV